MKKTKWFERKFDFSKVDVGVLPCIIERLRGTPARLEEMVSSLPAEILTAQVDGGWSIQEQVGHLWDLDELHEARLDDYRDRREVLRPADLKNRKTYEANHNEKPIADLLASFRSARASFVSKLEEIDDETLGITAIHPRLDQPMRVIDMALFVAEHDDHHLATITSLVRISKRVE